MKYAMFIGRYQPLHDGHIWLFNSKIESGTPVLICVRDVQPDEKNPWTASQVVENIESRLQDWVSSGMLKVIVIPDIEGVYYGRDVGYKIEQVELPPEIQAISATQKRKEMGI